MNESTVPESAVESEAAAPAELASRRKQSSRGRTNALAIAALILGVLLSPLAALFGHIAVAQITRSEGRERGLALAWVAVGLGYLWLASILIVVISVAVALSR